ncbi:MAG: PEP-CTERM sorting domain-containing protein [Acidobacteriaceae bacterium]|jgi:hypothetical protein
MKVLRCLFALTLVCAVSGMARADDFKLGVQDAPPTKIDYTGSPLDVGFGSCGFGTPKTDGCVTIENDTGKTITSLLIDIVANSYTIADGGGGCLSTTPGVVCDYSLIDDGTVYQFLFTGLDIPTNSEWCTTDTFTIEEQGIDPKNFPDATISSPTPEPASLMLLATGFLLCAGFIYRRRMGADSLGM